MTNASQADPSDVPIVLVVAAAENDVIGRKGQLPWRIPSDLKLFRELTIGKPVVMGRKTFQSIGKPLPGRDNIVITRDPTFQVEGVARAGSLDEALRRAQVSAKVRGAAEIAVIGGAEIFQQAMPRAVRIYLTRVHAIVEGETKLFPLVLDEWRATERRPLPQGPEDEFACTLIV